MPKVPETNQYEVTLLINCLLGLLVLPKELKRKHIPDTPISDLTDWGMKKEYIDKPGKDCVGRPRNINQITLLELTIDLRHSVAHTLFRTLGDGKKITHVELCANRSKFKATVPVEDFKKFVTKLANTVLHEAAAASSIQNCDAGK